MADSQSILQLGIEAARAGDKAEARELFRLVTREDPGNAQGWLWLAGVAEDREEKRAALERVVQLEPSNDLARKGLAALGGAAAARTTTSAPPTTAAPVAPPTELPRATPAAPPAQDPANVLDDDYAAAPSTGRAHVYAQPEPVGRYVPPDFGDDDYDLSEYQTQPQATLADPDERDRDTVVIVDDEEPRRRGFGAFWPLLLLGLVLLGVLLFMLGRNLLGDSRVAVDPNAGAGAAGSIAPVEGSAAGTVPNASSDATGLLASPGAAVGGDASAAGGTEGSAAAGGAAPGGATGQGSAPADAAGGGAVPGGAVGQGSALGGAPASAPAGGAAPAPGGAAASAPAGGAAPAPATSPAPGGAAAAAPTPTVAPAPTPAPTAAPTPAAAVAPPAPAPADPAAANPAIVGNDQLLRAGNFEYGYTGISNVATGSYGGAPPARGRYAIVLMTVRNIGTTPAQIPDGFFVIKDAQGRVSDFNRAASVDYINRFGGAGPRGAGDVAADATLPPGGLLSSVPLLFDVATDATNPVVFSRENLSQGFLVRQDVR